MLDGEKLWGKGFFWCNPFGSFGLSRQVSVVDEVCREAAFERTDLNRGWNPKRPAVSGPWWGLLWVYLGFSMIFFCSFKVQTTGLFRWWRNIFPTVEMVFTHRLEFETFSLPRPRNPVVYPKNRDFPAGWANVLTRRQGICWPGDSGLGQPSWCFRAKVLCQWIFKGMSVWRELA